MVTGRLRQRSWETSEGEKRSVTELEADEVGASLKWAKAKVERASQRGNGDRNSGRERQAERGDFNDPAHSYPAAMQRTGSAGALHMGATLARDAGLSDPILTIELRRTCLGGPLGQAVRSVRR